MRIGCDPELFLVNTDGKLISALGLLNADKWNPMQIPDLPRGFTLQEDNVSMEFGIPPATGPAELWDSLTKVLAKGLEFSKGLSFSSLSAAVFDPDQLTHPMANVFGCEPDFDAWGPEGLDEEGNPLNVNPTPTSDNPRLRSAGGHIHVETKENPAAVIRSMDLFLGVPSVLMDQGELRKQLYGKRGAHRVKPYGVEYRTLSNFWIREERLCAWVWEQTERALKNIGAAEYYDNLIRRAINENNKAAAEELVYECALKVL